MTQQLKQQYLELIALTQVFLLQNHRLHSRIISTPQTHDFFNKLILDDPKAKVSTSKTLPSAARPIASMPTPIEPQPTPPKPDLPPQRPQPAPPSIDPNPSLPPTIPSLSNKPPTSSVKSPLRAFTLEPLSETSTTEFQDIKEIVKVHFPQVMIFDQIPPDHIAQKIKKAWQTESVIPPIVLLSFNDQDKQLAFLKNVAQAITRHLAPARVLSGPKIEKEKKWDQLLNAPELKLIIAGDYGLYLQPDLMRYYKEASQQAKHFLKNTPLLLLSDLSLYLKEPQLKPLLWRTICTEFEAISHSKVK